MCDTGDLPRDNGELANGPTLGNRSARRVTSAAYVRDTCHSSCTAGSRSMTDSAPPQLLQTTVTENSYEFLRRRLVNRPRLRRRGVPYRRRGRRREDPVQGLGGHLGRDPRLPG